MVLQAVCAAEGSILHFNLYMGTLANNELKVSRILESINPVSGDLTPSKRKLIDSPGAIDSIELLAPLSRDTMAFKGTLTL